MLFLVPVIFPNMFQTSARLKHSLGRSQEREVGTEVERGIVMSPRVSCCEVAKSVPEAETDLVTTFSFSKITFIVIRESSSTPFD